MKAVTGVFKIALNIVADCKWGGYRKMELIAKDL